MLGAWTEGLLGRLGMALVGLASVAVPLAIGWAMLGVWLGRQQESQSAAERASADRGRRGAALRAEVEEGVPPLFA